MQRLLSGVKESPHEVSPEFISDLGRLIKETVEGLIKEPMEVGEDRVNIKVMCDLMEKQGVSLSYWESVMLIEELKGWYNIDLDLGEGIISGSTL